MKYIVYTDGITGFEEASILDNLNGRVRVKTSSGTELIRNIGTGNIKQDGCVYYHTTS